MKRIFALSALFLVGASTAATVPFSPALFSPTSAQVRAACDAGSKDGEAGENNFDDYTYFPITGLYIVLPTAIAYTSCSVAASQLKDKPKNFPTQQFIVTVTGYLSSLENVKGIVAAIVFKDKTGKQLFRLNSLSREDNLKSWKTYCTSSGCGWSGSVALTFKTPTPEQLKNVAKIEVLVNFQDGSGIQTAELYPE